jgi:transporter family-2 protein
MKKGMVINMLIMMIVAFMAGVTIVVSRMLNAKLTEYVGAHMSTFMNFVVGLLASILLAILVNAKLAETSAFSVNELPLYLGGILGVAMVFISNVITKKIPAYQLTLLMFVTQLFIGLILDYFVYDIFSAGKLVGGVFVLLGLWVSMKEEPKTGDEDPLASTK